MGVCLAGLPLLWTHGQKHGLVLHDVVRLLTTHTTQMCGLSTTKGAIQAGYDADFVIWDPEASFEVSTAPFG